ncbi:MAG: cyclohexanecarboxylate-CoA ligase [Deltaproteobacteria bacterium]|nr:cyclohexanecarboxylate-CoA ligase [Deltaproteobacteria bacterium]
MTALPTSFWSLVEFATREHPDQVVLADDHGRWLTAATLRDAAEQTAAGLYALGVEPGDVVSWQLPTMLESAVLMAACARLGAVQNPIIPVFRREVGFIVNQVDARLVIVPERWADFEHAEHARTTGRQVLALDLECEPEDGMRLPAGSPASLPAPLPMEPDAARWIYFSSGTTADPKGARHTDASVMASSNGVVDGLGLSADDVYPIAWPIAHIGGVTMLTAVLRTGGRLVLFDTFDPATTAERMAAHQPTILGSATPFFQMYIAAQRRHGSEALFPNLRTCVAGGAPTPTVINQQVQEVLGVSGAVGSWGLTEFPVATSETPDDPSVGTTVGPPAAGVQMRIVDGELRLTGPSCFLGYVDASLDADAFDEDGWFRTGDLGSVDDDGRIRIEGRIKDVIMRNAENISALEVEEALSQHPSVADVAVIGVPHDRKGEQVCAVVVAAPGHEVQLSELVEHCREAGLARYKCPERLKVVDALPRNTMGKIVKREIRVG